MREDWVEVELATVCFKARKVKRKEMPLTGKLKYLDIGGIDNVSNRIISHKVFTWENAPSRAQQIVKKGDTLFSTVRTYLKNIAQVKRDDYNGEICSSGFTVLRGNPAIIDLNYLFHLSLSVDFLNSLNKLQTGTSYPAVRDKDVFLQNIPLAPLPEQRTIVAKIEALFSDLDKGIADLKKAQAQLKVYRQAVLKKAFDGELTSTEMTSSNLSSLISIITKGASPKWQGFDYTSDKNQLLFITSENVREGYVSLKKEKYLPVGFNEIQKRSVLQKGDVLFNIVGASIGRAAIFELDKLSNINQAVALIRLNEEVLNQYVNYFLNSEGAKQEYLKRQVEVARANLSLQNVKDIEVPFCSKEEQHQIVQEIESRLSVCDKVEQTITESLEKAQALRQSILKKAFDGSLLSAAEIAACKAAPDYEPASVLLEKIKAEKSKQ